MLVIQYRPLDYILKMNNTTISLKQLANAIRILSADSVEKAKSGHPGMPLGFADVFTVLVTNYLKYLPQNPRWARRDRLILSNGHGSIMLYAFFYLAGYNEYTLDSLKNFRQVDSKTPGHPEYDPEGPVEVTTGPLGQGIANSVGIAIAQKKYEQRLGELMRYKVYCICGDGCLMEGISYEAVSIAGHLGLNNLVVLFDDNEITIDGASDLANSDSHIAKFQAMGWDAFSANGHDFDEINQALSKAQDTKKPTLICFKTKIGYMAGSKECSSASHGAPLGAEATRALKANLGWEEKDPFVIPEALLEQWREVAQGNIDFYKKWQEEFESLPNEKKSYLEFPDTAKLQDHMAKYHSQISGNISTRECSGRVIEVLMRGSDKIIAGSCDLGASTFVLNKYANPITKDDFSGNYIHYGVRENAMGAIMNGLATQNFLPIGSTFLVFSDYMRPAIRLSCLMNLPVIYIMTHDSIGLGEDGPTHQPIEHLASLRSIPRLSVYRPADMIEVQKCYDCILSQEGPALLALARQATCFMAEESRNILVSKGAYIFGDQEQVVDVSLWASGSELEIALDTKYLLSNAGIASRLISCPNIEVFLKQDLDYKEKLLDRKFKYCKLTCAIEAGSSFGWDRIVGDKGIFFGIDSFGASGPHEDLYKYFNLTPSFIANKIIKKLKEASIY